MLYSEGTQAKDSQIGQGPSASKCKDQVSVDIYAQSAKFEANQAPKFAAGDHAR
jgi:hypothetical protein